MFSHKKFNSSDSANMTERQPQNCVNRILGVYKETPKSRLDVFYLPVDPLSFRHNFDSCDATANATLTRTMSPCKLKYGVVRQNLT